MARARPISRASAWVVAIGGMKPMRISGWPSRASLAAKRRSQCRIISSPPPTAVPSVGPTAGPTESASRTYKVKKGDTLFAVAQRFDTTVAALIKLNNIKDPSLIHVGLVLKIP